MPFVNKLLDKARDCRSLTSDAALADALGVTRQTIHRWRTGASQPTDQHIAQMADFCGVDAGTLLVQVKADVMTGAAGRAWRSLASR
jgi:transcriptional regulator with XRE-family HTH domain